MPFSRRATVALFALGCSLLLSLPSAAAADPVLQESFDGAEGSVFVSQDAFWGNSDLGLSENATWMSESGRLMRRAGQGRGNSDYFRMWTRRRDLVDASVSLDVRFHGWAGASAGGWNGVNLWLNHSLCTPAPGCTKVNDGAGGETGYALDFMNRDGSLTILKKVPGDTRSRYPGSVSFANGGTYYQLAGRSWSPVVGASHRFTGSITPNSDGSRTLAIIVNGQKLLEHRDNGAVGGPPLRGGRAGVRSDFADVSFDNLVVFRGSESVAAPPPPPAPTGGAPVVGTIEGESMALAAGGGATFADTTASAGGAIQFWSNDTATATRVTSASATQLVVRARGAQCGGAPRMVVRIDGVIALERDVTATAWADHTGTVSVPAGTHTVGVSFTNDVRTATCDRNLYLDRVNLLGSVPVVPVGSVEGEALQLAAAGGTTFADSAAAGGGAMLIWSNDTATGTISTSRAASRLVVRARASNCNGAPRMVVKAGSQVLLDTLVSATSWTDHSATVAVPAGFRSVAVSFVNDFASATCDRNLYLDKVTMLG